MAVNKVLFGGNTLIDLTADTVNEQNLLAGITAHDASGAAITGRSKVKVFTYTMSNPRANKNFVMLNDPVIAAHYADESAVALLVKMTNRDVAGLNFAFCANKAISASYTNYQHIYGNYNGSVQNVATVSNSQLINADSTAGKLTAYENGDLAIYSAQSNNVVRAGGEHRGGAGTARSLVGGQAVFRPVR